VVELPSLERTRELLAHPATRLHRRRLRLVGLLVITLIALCVLSLLIGSRGISPVDVYRALLGQAST